MAGRPRKPLPLPDGMRQGQAVRVSNERDFKGYKLGLIVSLCKDLGVEVWLTRDSKPGFPVYTCIHEERGDTIVAIEKP